MTLKTDRVFLAGITGVAGSGKSSVSMILREKGFLVFDLDFIGHQALHDHDIKKQLENHFGKSIFVNNSICRKTLGKVVFNDPSSLSSLNSICWPWMNNKLSEMLLLPAVISKKSPVFLEAAVLFQGGFDQLCSMKIWVCGGNTAERLEKRRTGSSRILKSQENMEDFRLFCDYVLYNKDDESFLAKAVDDLINFTKNIYELRCR